MKLALIVASLLALAALSLMTGARAYFGGAASGNSQINTLDSINGSIVNAYGTWTFGPCVNAPTGAGPPGPWGSFCYVMLNGQVNNRIPQVGFASQIVLQGGEVTFLTNQNDRIQYGYHNYEVYDASCGISAPTLPCPTPGTPPNYHPPYTPSSDGTTLTSTPGTLTTLDGVWTNSGGGSSYVPTLNGIPFGALGGQLITSMRVDCNGRMFMFRQADNGWTAILGFGRIDYGSSFPICPIVTNIVNTPNPALVSGVIPGPQINSSTTPGTVVGTIVVTMSNGSPFTGTLSLNNPSGPVPSWLTLSGNNIVTNGVPTPPGNYIIQGVASPGTSPGPSEINVNVH